MVKALTFRLQVLHLKLQSHVQIADIRSLLFHLQVNTQTNKSSVVTGGGSKGKGVAFDTRDPGFDSHPRIFLKFIEHPFWILQGDVIGHSVATIGCDLPMRKEIAYL